MKDVIVVIKNASGETIAFKMERIGRYRDVEHLKEVYPDKMVISPDQLPKTLTY